MLETNWLGHTPFGVTNHKFDCIACLYTEFATTLQVKPQHYFGLLHKNITVLMEAS